MKREPCIVCGKPWGRWSTVPFYYRPENPEANQMDWPCFLWASKILEGES